MTRLTPLLTACCAVALAALPATGSAQGTNTKQRTHITFSAPVELPGATLPAGDYLIRLADLPNDDNVVEITTSDEQKVLATIPTVPITRPTASGNTIIMFGEN